MPVAASKVKLPYPLLPTITPLCATKVAALSMSLALITPLVLKAESASKSATLVSPVTSAASLVPVIVTVTVWGVPSAVLTTMLSV